MQLKPNKKASAMCFIAAIVFIIIAMLAGSGSDDSLKSKKMNDPPQIWYFTIKNLVSPKDALSLTLTNGDIFSDLEQIVNNFTSDQVMVACPRKTNCQFNLWTFTYPIATIIDYPGNNDNSIQIVPLYKYSNYNITVNGRLITISDAVKN